MLGDFLTLSTDSISSIFGEPEARTGKSNVLLMWLRRSSVISDVFFWWRFIEVKFLNSFIGWLYLLLILAPSGEETRELNCEID